MYFTMTGAKNIVCCTEVLYIKVPLVALRWNDFLAVLGISRNKR